MKRTTALIASTALAASAGVAVADGHMADSMTLVSWGGAYQASQQKAYVEPYLAANSGVSATWDESSSEAVAKLRAQNEAGNVTWDLVDAVNEGPPEDMREIVWRNFAGLTGRDPHLREFYARLDRAVAQADPEG